MATAPHYRRNMDRTEVRELLDAVAAGRVSAADAETRFRALPVRGFDDLGFARLDTHRGMRTGDPEVVFGPGKTPDQIVALLHGLLGQSSRRPALVSRLTDEGLHRVRAEFDDAVVDEVALVRDVGVAGIHRLLADYESLDRADCLVVVAGMEGALPSVVGGLVGTPMVAVPTSIGYGASFGGLAALLAMLNSCAPGITVVNIDNGFGAGVFAARVARRAGRP